ncbi:D-2-hydroxyacid dehydrogenase [uncultured Lactobacillus sp.]|uniref:D-2-hydroxyacid dehydrogenase n=1 Tax=uncultured Lactobacillus sp. TaxID=153152 RepID=UPI0028045A30|nr:D-2-hydroxyacid dehydrogenase [uncultured Lactobacillus sp.]
MKIALFNASQSELNVINTWNETHDDKIDVKEGVLTAENVDEVKGYQGIDLKQTVPLKDEEIYRKLHEFGLKSIGLRIVGTDIINIDLANKYKLKVTHVPVYSPRAIAEMAVTQAMYLLRHIGEFRENMDKNGDFTYPDELISDEIFNKTVGLIGVGNIGSAVAQIFSALGAKVLAYDVVYNPANEPFLTYTDFDTVIKESDIISLHTPLLPSTTNMIGEKELKEMKNSAYLINCARGGLIDTQALISALKNHEISGAGLDTLADENSYFGLKVQKDKIPADYKELAAMPNVVITPHSAFYTKTSVKNMVGISAKDIIDVYNGKKSRNAIN